METALRNTTPEHDRYARCIGASKRIRWEIERDVIRDRDFDLAKRFLPNGLSRVDELAFLSPAERRFLTQVTLDQLLHDTIEHVRRGQGVVPDVEALRAR